MSRCKIGNRYESRYVKVLICGGGTGGHIYPALAVVATLQNKGWTADDFLWVGTSGQVEEKLVPRAGIRLDTIEGGAIAGVSWPVRLRNSAKLILSLRKANVIIGRFKPDVLFLTGGYVNGPVAVAARGRRVPAAIYLPDIEPGMAIRHLSRLAERVACTAADSLSYFSPGKAVVTGYPVRPGLRKATELDRGDALRLFELEMDRQTLFVFGGSRGARSLNRALMSALPQLLSTIQIIHISGQLEWPEVRDRATGLDETQRRFYRPYPYLHDRMGAAYRAANLIVARAGASMLGECPAFGVPSILVPYPHAWRYQKINADYLVDQGAAIRLNDELLGEELAPTVMKLMTEQGKLAEMAQAAHKLDIPDAADNLSEVIVGIAKRAVS
jgi:undecaprenyldiphospho-muramoylpentapeptide beta-N-acetylglucosaminyltransferase